MSGTPTTSKMSIVAAGEPSLFDSLARLVPKDLQTAYYRVLAHTRTLSPDDEMLRILEAMGTLALLTRHTPKDIADERERFQEMFELHQQFSEEAQQKTLRYVRELESRLSGLPNELEAGLDPEQIAKLLGESLRQHFLNSGIPDTVKGLQATSVAMTTAQKELSTALRNLSDSRGAVAQIESANNRLTYSLDNRAKAVDALLREVRSDLLLRNRSHCPSRGRAPQCLAIQSSSTIARQRQSPAQRVSDRALFYRSCEVFAIKSLPSG
jgi:hypothetical protein